MTAQKLWQGLTERKDIVQKKVPIQGKAAKIAPSLASWNCFKALSDMCNFETMLLETEGSKGIVSAAPISISSSTPAILRVQKLKWEKTLPKSYTISATGESNSLKLKQYFTLPHTFRSDTIGNHRIRLEFWLFPSKFKVRLQNV